jgi:hypothetical protein
VFIRADDECSAFEGAGLRGGAVPGESLLQQLNLSLSILRPGGDFLPKYAFALSLRRGLLRDSESCAPLAVT